MTNAERERIYNETFAKLEGINKKTEKKMDGEKKWVKLSCGIHSGLRAEGDSLKCRKCEYHARFMRKYGKHLQMGGTPYTALISD